MYCVLILVAFFFQNIKRKSQSENQQLLNLTKKNVFIFLFQSTFQSLCPSKRETVFLNLDPEYEYRPDYYEEIRCVHGIVHSENKIQAAVSGYFCVFLL